MASARIALPGELGNAFTVAQARAAGVRRGRLRSPDLGSPLHAVRSRAGAGTAPGLTELATAAQLVLPGDAAFSHCTAAAL